MKNLTKSLLTPALAALVAAPALLADVPPQTGPIKNPAMQNPDEFAWQLFSELNRPWEPGSEIVFWRTWPEQGEVYLGCPDPSNPPKWSEISGPDPHLQAEPGNSIQKAAAFPQLTISAETTDPNCATYGDYRSEEVRINEHAFKYLIEKDLWYLEGKKNAFQATMQVNFPTNAREVKADWLTLERVKETQEKLGRIFDAEQFHQAKDSRGTVWLLVSIHISTKDLPSWFWTTFEHVTNPCRTKHVTPQDRFGLDSNGKVTPALLGMFAEHGLGPDPWQHYRLDGVQVSYTEVTGTGQPVLLGNSVTEYTFQATSSCMTCHSRATTDYQGNPLPIFNPYGQSYNGAPDPSWFAGLPKPAGSPPSPAKQGRPYPLYYLPLDFVWSAGLCPNSTTSCGTAGKNCQGTSKTDTSCPQACSSPASDR